MYSSQNIVYKSRSNFYLIKYYIQYCDFFGAASQQEGSEFNLPTGWCLFGVKFACSPCACVGFLRLLWLPPTV